MVLAYHVIFTAYGFWLPNDPRGSWSEWVRRWELFLHGRATKTNERRSLAREPHDYGRRRAAKESLMFDPVELTGRQALSVARGFAHAIAESGYVLYACSILPAHVHGVVARPLDSRNVERMIGHLKARATQSLVEDGLHPFVEHRGADGRFPSVWAHRAWKVFLNNAEHIRAAIDYVEQNPVKDGKRRQYWSFLTPFDGVTSRAAPRKRVR